MLGHVKPTHGFRAGLVRSAVFGAALVMAAACSDSGQGAEPAAIDGNRYSQTILVANSDAAHAPFTQADLVNAWGLVDRPKGAGGHFWVGAGGKSFQFLGDVHSSSDPKLQKLTQDGLKTVVVPGADAESGAKSVGKTTGAVFNGAPLNSDVFVVRDQPVTFDDGFVLPLTGSARIVFATDSGRLAAWTELAPDGATVRRDGPAMQVFDGSAQGMAFTGLAVAPSGDRLLAADFGETPQLRTFDKFWQPVATTGFANPFATGEVLDVTAPEKGRKAVPGDPVPFNVTTIGGRVFVTYAISGKDPADAKKFAKGAEVALDAKGEQAAGGTPDRGKIVEFDAAGKLVRILDDDGRLNAPWGVTIAPSNFGVLSGKLLVGNSAGLGRVLAYDDTTGKFTDYLRDGDAKAIEIAGLHALVFGDGDTLGDANALYFTAGPDNGRGGRFGSLRLK